MSNEMLASKVEELRSVNQSLTKELRDMKDKYDESLTLYAQAQVSLIINYSVNLFFFWGMSPYQAITSTPNHIGACNYMKVLVASGMKKHGLSRIECLTLGRGIRTTFEVTTHYRTSFPSLSIFSFLPFNHR